MELTSLSLLDRLQHKPLEADWTRLVALYQPFIVRFIRFDARVAHDAEDICQEVLRKVVEHLPRFHRVRDGSFRAWLRTITVNEVNHYWRQRYRGKSLGGEAAGRVLEALADPGNHLSRQWDHEHGNHVLLRLQELIEPEFSPETWQAFRMRVFEERSTDDVARSLGMSRNAVDIAKSRVLARLRKESAGFIED
jgi:RNA polymerase sigma-70 factor (ECF subfamily)